MYSGKYLPASFADFCFPEEAATARQNNDYLSPTWGLMNYLIGHLVKPYFQFLHISSSHKPATVLKLYVVMLLPSSLHVVLSTKVVTNQLNIDVIKITL